MRSLMCLYMFAQKIMSKEWQQQWSAATKDINSSVSYTENSIKLRELIKTGLLKFTDIGDDPSKFFLAHRLLVDPSKRGPGKQQQTNKPKKIRGYTKLSKRKPKLTTKVLVSGSQYSTTYLPGAYMVWVGRSKQPYWTKCSRRGCWGVSALPKNSLGSIQVATKQNNK